MTKGSLVMGFILAISIAACAQEKKDSTKKEAPKLDRQGQLESIIKDFVEARKEASKDLRTAKTDQEKKAAEAKLPKEKDFLPRLHQLIQENGKDEIAAEACTFAIFAFESKDEKILKALNDLAKTDAIERFVLMATNGGPDSVKPVLQKVLAENPTPKLKGLACFALGSIAFEKQENPQSAKEAEEFFVRVEKDFAAIKVEDGTLGDMVKGSLFELRNLGIGKPAPATLSKTLKGDKTSLADHKGKVVVLDIWATWCGPCRAMIPHEREMVEKLKDKPFVLISVSADKEKADLEQFLEKEKMPWVHWWDGDKAPLLKDWNVRFFPTIYVIDDKGIIRHKNIRGEQLEKAVEKLVAEVKK